MKRKRIDIIQASTLFSGVDAAAIPAILSCLEAQEKTFCRGETILHLGDVIRKIGIVLSGKARVQFYDESSNPITVRHLTAADTFGQVAACKQEYKSPIELTAVSDCHVLFLDITSILDADPASCTFYNQVSANLIRDLAGHAAFLNLRLRIIGQKHLRDRLLLYLRTCPQEEDGTVTIPFSMTDLAAFLNVDRSALYREIRLLREEGVLDWDRRNVKLIRRPECGTDAAPGVRD